MKVRFIVAVTGPDICVGAGEEKDLPRPDAKYWIKIGYAEEVEEPKQKPLTVQEIKRTAKRVVRRG